MIWVKICGTTNLADAQAAVEAGADALGFIFAPSPRRISPRDAARMIRELPPAVEKIGVFVNQKPAIIRHTVAEAGLTGVQLHGDEDHELVNALPGTVRVMKAIAVRPGFEAELEAFPRRAPDLFLLDSGGATRRGGTGHAFEWEEAAPVVRLAARRFKLVIAGGLTPANVVAAIDQFRPFGVDVVSGVESEPGRKDHARLRAFISAAKSAMVK